MLSKWLQILLRRNMLIRFNKCLRDSPFSNDNPQPQGCIDQPNMGC